MAGKTGLLLWRNDCSLTSPQQIDSFKVEMTLGADSVALWRASLEWEDSDIGEAAKILSPDEQKRAARFHRAADRKHFIAAHAALRIILAGYLKTDPGRISFTHNASGKPRVMDDSRSLDLRFNLAHSGGVGLYAFAVGQEVGVDLEFIQPDFASMSAARNSFAPEEVNALCALRGKDFVAGFYRCWTRKEAYAKARGLGLSLPLSSFVVSVQRDETPLLLVDRFDIGEQARWMLLDVNAGAGFAAALAVQRRTTIPPRIIEFEYHLTQAVPLRY